MNAAEVTLPIPLPMPLPIGVAKAVDWPVVVAEGVAVRFDEHVVLDAVDLTLLAGEVHALIGPNGAGKSTLLAALAGDLPLAAGRVLLDGDPVPGWGSVDLARRRAVLLQEQRISFPFSVADVVAMGRAPWRGTAEEGHDEEIVVEALELADLAGLEHRTVPTLSGGEKARTAFARMLAQTAGVLLLDEPTAALDIRHQEELLALARAAAAEGCAVAVVLHDLTLAAAYSDRVTLLDDGRVHSTGRPSDVLTGPILTEVYRHPIRVVDLPGSGLVVLPHRPTPGSPR